MKFNYVFVSDNRNKSPVGDKIRWMVNSVYDDTEC